MHLKAGQINANSLVETYYSNPWLIKDSFKVNVWNEFSKSDFKSDFQWNDETALNTIGTRKSMNTFEWVFIFKNGCVGEVRHLQTVGKFELESRQWSCDTVTQISSYDALSSRYTASRSSLN